MDLASMENCCRICLGIEKTFLSLKTEVESEGVMVTCMDMYSSITAIEEHYENIISNKVCISCFSELNNYYRFKKKALESFNTLLQAYRTFRHDVSLANDDISEEILNKYPLSLDICVENEDYDSREKIEHRQDIPGSIENDASNDCGIEIQKEDKSERINQTTDVYDEEFLEMECTDTKVQDQLIVHVADEILDVIEFSDHEPNPQIGQENEQNLTTQVVKCMVCSKQLKSQAELDSHFVAEHCQQEPDGGHFICPVCNKRFGTRKTLRQHCRIHQDRELRRFRCRYCDKSFNYSHHLKIHETTHTMEKPFSCSSCTKQFASKDRLRNHELQHVDSFRYKCESCSSSFRSRKALKMHAILKHDAAVDKFEPVECGNCGKGLYSQSAASAHLKGPCGSNSTEANKVT
ncbi:zinc finger and BTB domain-containing protein 14-like [Topomyia yanbarensis]|uniref:zinc finger and BTB domain-containing protein 14-like n=1 Tax=Topomyia yanbarensis TaxID=2498891 RepID=UPI00273ACCED|nr:zinc finger and BTB domain-containing protein 14-like [Topomyia yanbarensis]